MLVACDVYRPAAINQLHVVGDQIGVEVYSELGNNNPVEIAQNAVKYAKEKGYNVVIVDTAGRLAVDEQMMTEIANVHQALQPQETLFVVDAMQARRGSYLGVALAPASTTSQQIMEMDKQGFRAIRFNFMAHLKNSDSMEEILALTKRMEPFGWHLQVHFSSDLVHSLAPLLKKSAVPVMVDHVGRVDASLGANHADFQGLLKLFDDPLFYVKVSGVDRISKMHPYEDGVSLAKILVDEFTDRCVWGTDWPHPNHHHIPDDGNLVDLIPGIADTAEKVSKLMVGNPGKFYRFE